MFYFLSMMTAFLFDGHIRNITNLDYDIYITFTISAALELPADLGRGSIIFSLLYNIIIKTIKNFKLMILKYINNVNPSTAVDPCH